LGKKRKLSNLSEADWLHQPIEPAVGSFIKSKKTTGILVPGLFRFIIEVLASAFQ
jgi:hypothetical protein